MFQLIMNKLRERTFECLTSTHQIDYEDMTIICGLGLPKGWADDRSRHWSKLKLKV